MGSHQSARMVTDQWLTPESWIHALGGADSFFLDPCAAPHAPEPWPTARNHYCKSEINGLTATWWGRVWLNPPFGNEAQSWMKKMAAHGHGTLLVAARTETKYWREYIWKAATAILFVDHRPHFCRPDGSRASANSGVPIALVAYGELDADVLRVCGIGGAYISQWELKEI